MSDNRPNPDELLARVHDEESRANRGKLRIFFGYAAGVGKTYAMLQAANRERAEGADIIVGYVEPHNRPDTEALLQDIETIPVLSVTYRGAVLREFDLDAALARKPSIILVDELAHTNAPGMRHPKRWHDVEELRAAGIDVWTTLNVQHIESLNDVITQITGVAVKETLPDKVLENADEIELIDISPDNLMDRLTAGKVYLPAQAERALKNFFQKGNLVALRELSLRQAATRVQRDVDLARQERSAVSPWVTSERLLVCVGPSPTNTRIIRATKRLAQSLGAEWLAVAVDCGVEGTRSQAIKEFTARNLRFAEELGAETQTLVGDNVADTVIDFAAARNVTKIVAGKTAQPRWRQWFARSIVDELLKKSGAIDVYFVTGEGDSATLPASGSTKPSVGRSEYLSASAVVFACSMLGWVVRQAGLANTNVVMIFLAGVAIVAAWLGRGPSVAATIVSVAVFDFFFVPPQFTFAVSDTQYVITFVVMLGIGLFISHLTSRLKAQLGASQQHMRRTAELYRMTRQLSELSGTEFLARSAGRQLREIFDGEAILYLREPNGTLTLRFGEETTIAAQSINEVVAQWVATNGRTAGAGTDTLPNATAVFVPLAGSQHVVGALGVASREKERFLDPEQLRLLETCGSLIALSIERDQFVLDAHEAQLKVQSEQLRNSLLSSVSHDLRTPLTTIAGSAGTLLQRGRSEDRELLQDIADEARRLNRLVENLLDMALLDSGAIEIKKQWHVLEEIIGSAVEATKRELSGHHLQIAIPEDFPLLYVDGVLMEQVLVNLLDNAARYTPPQSQIEISAQSFDRRAEIRVADNGPGLPAGSESKVFDKFFRGSASSPDSRRGVGLGLTICSAIIEAHGGEITAITRSQGGAEFIIVLPFDEPPPKIPVETDSVPITS